VASMVLRDEVPFLHTKVDGDARTTRNEFGVVGSNIGRTGLRRIYHQ
jgi:hypothetical protein